MVLRLGFLLDLVRVFWILPLVEQQRNRLSLHAAVAAARKRATRLRARTPEQRQWLRRAITAIDSRLGSGPNCVRRVLLEISLDRGAATDQLMAGFKAGGGERSGHAWLASNPEPGRDAFDAVISI